MSNYWAKLISKYRKRREVSAISKAHIKRTTKRDRKTASKKKSKLSTNQRTLIAFFATLVLLVIGGVVIKDLRKEEKVPLVELSRHEEMLAEGSQADLMKYVVELEKQDLTGNLPGQIDVIKKQLEVGKRIEFLDSRRQVDSTHVKLVRLGLIAKLEGLYHEHSLGAVDDELTQYVNEQLNSTNPNIGKLANLVASFTCVSRYLQFPTTENFAGMQNQLERSSVALNNDFENLEKLIKTVNLVSPNEGNAEERLQLYYKLASILRASENPEIREIGDQVHDHPLITGFDFEEMTINAYLNDPKAVELGLQFIDQVANGQPYSNRAYSLAIYLLEMLERKGNQKQVEQSKDRLISSAATIDDEFVRVKSLNVVLDYVKRSNLAGKPFDFEIDGDKTDFSKLDNKPVLIAFYDLTFNSKEMMESIRNLEYLYTAGLQLVCINYEPVTSMLLQTNMKTGFTEEIVRPEMKYAIHVSPEQADDFLAACPVKRGPYLVLLNKDHVVEAVNLDPDQIRKLIEAKNLLAENSDGS